MSQQVVTTEHSFLDSQQAMSLVVEQPNNPIANRINKFFIFDFFYSKFMPNYLTGIGVPTGYGNPSFAAVTEVIPESTGIANLNGTAASFKGP